MCPQPLPDSAGLRCTVPGVPFSTWDGPTSNPQLSQRLAFTSRVLAVAAAALVAASAAGVLEPYAGRVPGAAAAAFAAASGSVLCAQSASRRLHAAQVLLAGVLAIATLWSLGAAALTLAGSAPTGAPSLETALTVALCSLAAAALGSRRLTVRVGQPAAGAALTLSLALTAGHINDPLSPGMALATALCAPLLALATLFARPRLGVMRLLSSAGDPGGMARRIGVVLLVAPFAIAALLAVVDRGEATPRQLYGVFIALQLAVLGAAALMPLSAAAASEWRALHAEEELARTREAASDLAELTAALSEDLQPTAAPADGLDVEVLSEPASGHLAGDVAAVEQVDGQHAVVLLDVAGHGPRAALFASWAKHQLLSSLHEGRAPAAAVAALEQLCRTHAEIASVFLAVVSDTSLRWASAGHPPALVVSDGRLERLGATGPLLGAGGRAWPEQICDLPPGATLVVTSDGLVEARNTSGVEWGPERLEALVARRHAEGPAALAEAVRDAARTHAGSRLTDDATVIAVTRTAG